MNSNSANAGNRGVCALVHIPTLLHSTTIEAAAPAVFLIWHNCTIGTRNLDTA